MVYKYTLSFDFLKYIKSDFRKQHWIFENHWNISMIKFDDEIHKVLPKLTFSLEITNG